jgi:nucleoside-diphosphate-sugar epimerase
MDVRDVADMHLRAMTSPAAKGERFLAVVGPSISLLEVASILKKHIGSAAHLVPTRELPDWIVRFFALFISDMKMIAPEPGNKKNVSNESAKHVLGWIPPFERGGHRGNRRKPGSPRPAEDVVS